jgi:2-polyprenyl-6-methoxyphenol hydroxylase-like FAD-dependent oxidoreductase
MVRDIGIDQNRDVYLDDGNDLGLVSGNAQLEQSVAIDVLDETRRFIGSTVTAQTIGLLEQRIGEGLADDPQVATIRDVSVEEFDKRDNSVTVSVSVAEDEDFTLTVNA